MGPLRGIRVLELAGLGPAPFGCMVLADLGAEVLQVHRPGGTALDELSAPLQRGRRVVRLDLTSAEGRAEVLRLADGADVLVEGFRPGVVERLGVGPGPCRERNPRLIYARMTGWGQDGPLATAAGHDINYLGLTGLLHLIGPGDRPPLPPLNLVADFGGGGMLLAVGVLAALVELGRSGEGQTLDVAMVDGAALLGTLLYGMRSVGLWTGQREANPFDGGAPFYRTYQTSDGRYVAVGALERPFYDQLLDGLGLTEAELPSREDRKHWPELHERFGAVFATRTRDEWVERFAGTDACVTPVLTMAEAPRHPHHTERRSFVEIDGVVQPAAAPRFSRWGTPPMRPPVDLPPGAGWAEAVDVTPEEGPSS